MPRSMRHPFEIGRVHVAPGTRALVDFPVGKLTNHAPVSLPIHVLHGLRPGPTMFVSAAIHGDELNGVEIVRRLVKTLQPNAISGTLLAVPVVNSWGYLDKSRYLPDRRDLNRSFPGKSDGPLGSRLAHIFMKEVVRRAQFGIDLHTAAVHRQNLPQIRCDFTHGGVGDNLKTMAQAFGAPVVLKSPERGGSLRKAAREAGVDVLVYEGGEGLRLDGYAIEAGVGGIANVMLALGMLELPDGVDPQAHRPDWRPPTFAHASKWVRAPESGLFRSTRKIGDAVGERDILGYVANPNDVGETVVRSPARGLIIGKATLPVVNAGDALFHIAWGQDHERVTAEPPPDEDEVN